MADSCLHTPVFGVLVALSLSVTRIQAQTETTTAGPEDDGVSSIQWYIWLILAAAAVVALILIAVILCFLLRLCARSCRRSLSQPEAKARKRKLQQQQQQQHLLVSEKSAHLLVEDEDYCSKNINWEISRAKIRLIRQLGIGEFGAVYDAEVRLGKNMKSRALVKVFQKGTPQDLVLFWQEMQEVMKLQHPRVARLFGVVSRSPYFAVFELPVNGDLKTFLISIKSSGTKFTVPQLIGMAAELASGMVYLENMEYVHKDVAARNCVVTQNLGVKIADYGVGRYLFRSEYAVQADGSLMAIRWMAPESLAENLFSLFSDAWSFGVLVWEIMTVGQFPYTELTDAEVVHRVCYEYQRLLQPLECPENIYKLMLRCWHKDPTERPSMLWLQQQLETGILPQSRETSPIPSPAPLDPSFDAIAAHDAMQY